MLYVNEFEFWPSIRLQCSNEYIGQKGRKHALAAFAADAATCWVTWSTCRNKCIASMRPVATDRGVVCLCVWLDESCINGWTDHDAVWGRQINLGTINHGLDGGCTLAPPGKYDGSICATGAAMQFVAIMTLFTCFFSGLGLVFLHATK